MDNGHDTNDGINGPDGTNEPELPIYDYLTESARELQAGRLSPEQRAELGEILLTHVEAVQAGGFGVCQDAVPYSPFYEVIIGGRLVARCTHPTVHEIYIGGA
jgi:hypothetical protein